ncbi:MAG: class I SAM-dependent rRNA methyltransferase [Gammaproteobacteria bacterium]|nr:class I SAM-dependent rRNA methyltransferase [Gammaproteobacteria bacterium]MDH5653372.1 class I SAM-dependent rRNA methyltransferase [Gammaproteobacteria bacterium]
MSSPLPPLRLKKQEDRRLRTGHLWIYSNEVDTKITPLTAFEAGDLVQVEDHRGQPLGTAYVNSRSLISARLLTRRNVQPDQVWFKHRLQQALALRENLFADPCYRLIYGESDGLPGLVVDRFGPYLVVQITTAGMERMKEMVITGLTELLNPAGILLRNDSSAREQEGLPLYSETVSGNIPDETEVIENGISFTVPLLTAQKTGWYYDHRLNRSRMTHYVKDKRVLDVFCYAGAWGVQALQAGAKSVSFIDASARFTDVAKQNAQRYGKPEQITALSGDAFEMMKGLQDDKQQFDVIILDPPAFIKRRKDIKAGMTAYHRANQQAFALLAQDGVLITASCSHHLAADQLWQTARKAAGTQLVQILEQGYQGPDHPIHAAMPETAYLKAFFCRPLSG